MGMGSAAAPSSAHSPSPGPWWVVCLCAQWCGACREYRGVFEELAGDWPQVRFEWVDVEDEEDVVGEVDVETFPTILIADGQVARFLGPVLPQAQVLGQTPAALIAEATDLNALKVDFTLTAEPARDGLQWVKAVPKARDGQLQQVQVGFDGAQLAALEILDSFGQRSVLRFGPMQLNPQLPAGAFQFKPPAGADVLRQ